MSMSNKDKYQWFDPWLEELNGEITLTLVRINSAEEFFTVVGAQLLLGPLRGISAVALEYTPESVPVGVTPVPGKPGWFLGAESPMDVGYEKAAELSVPGGIAVAFRSNETSGSWFTWAEGGVTLAKCSLEASFDTADAIDGSDPPRLVAAMRAARLDPDDTTYPGASAAALIEVITREGDIPGVVITAEILDEAEFTAGSVPYPYW